MSVTALLLEGAVELDAAVHLDGTDRERHVCAEVRQEAAGRQHARVWMSSTS